MLTEYFLINVSNQNVTDGWKRNPGSFGFSAQVLKMIPSQPVVRRMTNTMMKMVEKAGMTMLLNFLSWSLILALMDGGAWR